MKLAMSPLLVAVVVGALACGPGRFTYAPVATTSAEVGGMAAAVYPVTSSAGEGDIHVAVLDLMDIRYRTYARSSHRALRITFVVSNRSTTAWRMEAREQRIELGEGHARVVLEPEKEATSASSPVDVPPGSTRWVDLTFLVPDDVEDARLDVFDLTWNVQLGPDARISRLTRFEKLRVAPAHVGVERPADRYAPMGPPPSPGMPLPGSTPPARPAPDAR